LAKDRRRLIAPGKRAQAVKRLRLIRTFRASAASATPGRTRDLGSKGLLYRSVPSTHLRRWRSPDSRRSIRIMAVDQILVAQ